MKILTTYPIPESQEWQKATFLINIHPKRFKRIRGIFKKFGIYDWWLPFKLLLLRNQYDVLFTGAEREDEIFSFLQTMLVFGKIKHVMVDCLWKQEKSTFLKVIKRILLQTISKSISVFVFWTKEEVESYHREFGIPKNKIRVYPHPHTMTGYQIEARDEGYIFAGGDSSRDYATLIEAVRYIPIKVKIALRNLSLLKGLKIPENVEINTLSPKEFRQILVNSRIVVVPIKRGLLQTAGQQTYFNAMIMRKPIIVSDVSGAREYIEHGKTGFLVPPEDVSALKNAILEVISNDGKLSPMLDEAYQMASTDFSLERFVERNLDLARSVGRLTKERAGC